MNQIWGIDPEMEVSLRCVPVWESPCAQQPDTFSCGVFVLCFIHKLCQKLPLSERRKQLAVEIDEHNLVRLQIVFCIYWIRSREHVSQADIRCRLARALLQFGNK